MSSLYRILADRQLDVLDQHQRGTRFAVELRTYDTVGAGGAFVSAMLPFDVEFVDVPSVSYGTQLLRVVPVADLPLCSGGVHGWEKNTETGSFTGARVWVRMVAATTFEPPETQAGATPVVIPIRHHFTFTGMARSDPRDLARVMERGLPQRRPLFGQ